MTETELHKKPTPRNSSARFLPYIAIVVAVVLTAAIVFVALYPWPCTVSVNGKDEQVTIRTTLQDAIHEEMRFLTAGNLMAVDGSVIEEGGGTPFTLYVNGKVIEDVDAVVHPDDVIVVEDGVDKVEEFTEERVEVNPPVLMEGTGAVHRYTNVGVAGHALYRTGKTSGIVFEEKTEYQGAEVVRNFNVDTHGDKVIALTFDDGPWEEYTPQILDILRDNEAKGTFFTVGTRVAALPDIVKRASDEGHQICTHTWDHASGSGKGLSLDYMSAEEQLSEVLDGYNAIEQATGREASHVFRAPGGNFTEGTASVLVGIVTSEIGWNIDTNDWQKPGPNVIYDRIMQAEPGNIILMHDGGGDRSQTVEALRNALPKLREQGYRFITIDELLTYAPQEANIADVVAQTVEVA